MRTASGTIPAATVSTPRFVTTASPVILRSTAALAAS